VTEAAPGILRAPALPSGGAARDAVALVRGLAACACLCAGAAAQAVDFDYHLVPQAVARDVFVFVGRSEDFSVANGGNIVNTGFIAGRGGVIVVDTGPSRRYGQQMRQAIAAAAKGPVVLTLNTHHHPDHFLGNQAFDGASIAALAGTGQGIAAEGNAFAENLFRLTGDWMKDTEVVAPSREVAPGRLEVAGRRLRLLALDGHTGADLAIYDEASGVLFAGDLVFNGRAPTTPHASIDRWLAALDRMETITREAGFKALVPGHGAVARDAAPIRQTRAWLTWLNAAVRQAADEGLDVNEALRRPLPPQFAGIAVAESEYRRSMERLFPAAEQEVLRHADGH
jgi:quinoprotein relay system zinc metallohydrolase 1